MKKKPKQCKHNVEENDNEDLFREEGWGGKKGFVGNRRMGQCQCYFFPEISLNSNSQYYECNLVLISTSKFFKDKKFARASRGSEDFDCHHKIYLIPTKALKSFHDSPPPLLAVYLQSIFQKIYNVLPKSSISLPSRR